MSFSSTAVKRWYVSERRTDNRKRFAHDSLHHHCSVASRYAKLKPRGPFVGVGDSRPTAVTCETCCCCCCRWGSLLDRCDVHSGPLLAPPFRHGRTHQIYYLCSQNRPAVSVVCATEVVVPHTRSILLISSSVLSSPPSLTPSVSPDSPAKRLLSLASTSRGLPSSAADGRPGFCGTDGLARHSSRPTLSHV